MVGFDTSDDACVYQVNDQLALVQTVDFFPPMVDDPYLFGQIAAANALSDVYAMGATPKLAMNLLCYPTCLPPETVRAILAGGADKAIEAGAILAGGHTIEDKEPKYGLSVTGFVHPAQILANVGAQPGDRLVLTKAIGTGVLTTAMKADMITAAQFAPTAASMAMLNKAAAEALAGLAVHACTDITGFGLLGHAGEMARGSGVSLRLQGEKIPLLPEARALAEMGILPAGVYKNAAHIAAEVGYAEGVPRVLRDLMTDPQTSGGLLVSLPEADAQELCRRIPAAWIIGEVTARQEKLIIVE